MKNDFLRPKATVAGAGRLNQNGGVGADPSAAGSARGPALACDVTHSDWLNGGG